MATTTASPEALEQKEGALAHVREERRKLGEQLPKLTAAAKTARVALERAQLGVFVARGTPGFEDDAAAQASVAKAQADLDAVCVQRDQVEERTALLDRAEAQLVAEVSRIKGALHLAHIERSKKALRERIDAKAPVLAALVQEITALRTLEGLTTWPQELGDALRSVLRKPEDRDPMPDRLSLAVRDGQGAADRIRAGATVVEVTP